MHPFIREMIRRADDRQYDPWGTVIGQGFAICEVLSAPDCAGTVPAELDYRHGACAPRPLSEIAYDDDSG